MSTGGEATSAIVVVTDGEDATTIAGATSGKTTAGRTSGSGRTSEEHFEQVFSFSPISFLISQVKHFVTQLGCLQIVQNHGAQRIAGEKFMSEVWKKFRSDHRFKKKSIGKKTIWKKVDIDFFSASSSLLKS
jgi:hypothetical protein